VTKLSKQNEKLYTKYKNTKVVVHPRGSRFYFTFHWCCMLWYYW